MPQFTIDQAMQLALSHHQAGRLGEAEEIYRQVLQNNPRHAGALHLLGVIARQAGQPNVALDLINRAIGIDPRDAGFHFNLGSTLHGLKRHEEAITAFREALRLRPDFVDAHNNLGNALYGRGLLDEAVAAYRKAAALNPTVAEIHNNLSVVLRDLGNFDEAIDASRAALRLNPNLAVALNNLGNALGDKGLYDQAATAFQQALRLDPNLADAHNSLGNALNERGRITEAIAAFHRAVELRPDYPEAFNNLGVALEDNGDLDAAAAAFDQALKLKPNFAQALGNLGNVYKDHGDLGRAVESYGRALELRPDLTAIHSNLVYSMYFHPEYSPKDLLRHHRKWDQVHGQPLRKFILPHSNLREPERRIRIGYVSPDLMNHPVGRFMFAPMKAHDHKHFEIFAYSSVRFPDSLTPKLKACADVWRDVPAVPNEKLAEIIREDQIDILIDLTMHMAGNRMPLFARKPAPVQVTYLAYAGTTGLSAIDYRITDNYLDPPGVGDEFYAENSVRVTSFWCYHEPKDNLPQAPPPAEKKGFITFGCLNNLSKINPATLELWAQILYTVSKSRLHIHAKSGRHREKIREIFSSAGVNPDRLSFIDKLPLTQYLAEYEQIDIGLDTLHYVGGTTSCDALWMGVPVITLEGTTSISRGGVSIMHNIGIPELIAATTEDYVTLAADLANDPNRIRHLRQSLRQTMRDSALMDAKRFTRELESAYRAMWKQWCAS